MLFYMDVAVLKHDTTYLSLVDTVWFLAPFGKYCQMQIIVFTLFCKIFIWAPFEFLGLIRPT